MEQLHEMIFNLDGVDSPVKGEDVEYAYLTIPAKYICIYHRLLVYLADLGKNQIDDCNATCKGNGKNVITCWNLFQSAIACHNLKRYDEADFFINYIKKQIDNIYGVSDKTPYNNMIPVSITPDGKLKAIVSCGDDTKFYVDFNTGVLYEQYKEKIDNNDTFNINNNYLIHK